MAHFRSEKNFRQLGSIRDVCGPFPRQQSFTFSFALPRRSAGAGLPGYLGLAYAFIMTIAELQNAIRSCSKEDQDQLAAFLAVLRQRRDPEYLATLDARINDRDPRQWVSLDVLKEQFRND